MQIVEQEFTKYGYSFPKREAGKCLIRCASCFDKRAKQLLPMVGRNFYYDNDKSIHELNLNYRDVKQTIVEMGYSLIEKHLVKENKLFHEIIVTKI